MADHNPPSVTAIQDCQDSGGRKNTRYRKQDEGIVRRFLRRDQGGGIRQRGINFDLLLFPEEFSECKPFLSFQANLPAGVTHRFSFRSSLHLPCIEKTRPILYCSLKKLQGLKNGKVFTYIYIPL